MGTSYLTHPATLISALCGPDGLLHTCGVHTDSGALVVAVLGASCDAELKHVNMWKVRVTHTHTQARLPFALTSCLFCLHMFARFACSTIQHLTTGRCVCVCMCVQALEGLVPGGVVLQMVGPEVPEARHLQTDTLTQDVRVAYLKVRYDTNTHTHTHTQIHTRPRCHYKRRVVPAVQCTY